MTPIEITLLVLAIILLAPLAIILGIYLALIIVAILAMVTMNALYWLDGILNRRHSRIHDANPQKETTNNNNQ